MPKNPHLAELEREFLDGIDANDLPSPQYYIARAILLLAAEVRATRRTPTTAHRKRKPGVEVGCDDPTCTDCYEASQ